MQDSGDEHVDRPPPPIDPIMAIIAGLTDEERAECTVDNPAYWDALMHHEFMRLCCVHCAKEVDSEDGS